MAIDLLNLQPTKISRDLKSKFMMIYGEPKSGKTSLATQLPKSLLIAFEIGYHGLANISAQDCPTWVSMKEILRDLRRQEVKERFDCIIIDTASVAYDRCIDYTCQQFGVKDLTDVPWGKGTKACAKEFEKMWREITLLGYGIIFLTHAEEKIPFGGDESQTFIAPMLDKRPYRIINAMVDIIACIDIDPDTSERFLQLRSTPKMVAGSRFKYMPDRIPLSYDALVTSLAEAIEKQGDESGGMITDERIEDDSKAARPFSEVMDEAREIWTSILEKDDSDVMLERLEGIIEDSFGSRIKLSSVIPKQQGLLELVVLDMKDLLNSLA